MLFAHLQAFAAVARTGNITRAAEQLFLTQPALTARLQALEREVGEQLFVRDRRGTRLTELGRAYLPHAQRALQAAEDGQRHLEALRRGSEGELVIGGAPAVSTYVLPAVLKQFRSAYPGIRISVRTGHSEEVLALVLSRAVQIGLVRALDHPDVSAIPIYEDELVLVVDPAHAFARRDAIRLREIAAEQLILFDRTSSYHGLTSALFREAGVVPRSLLELDNVEAAKKMVEAGLGVALLPRIALEAELAGRRLREVRVRDVAPVRRPVVALRARDAGPPAPAVAAFLAGLRELPSSLVGRRRRTQDQVPTTRPPSTLRTAPLTKEASSDARYR